MQRGVPVVVFYRAETHFAAVEKVIDDVEMVVAKIHGVVQQSRTFVIDMIHVRRRLFEKVPQHV